MYLIKEASDWSGVSVRTLQYYDEIGLLQPKRAGNGYRWYSEEDLDDLQMILSYKYLGIPLSEIKKLLGGDSEDQLRRLRKQLTLMEKEKDRLSTIINTLEQTIEAKEKRMKMSNQEKFKGFAYEDHEEYKQEAIEKYGEKVVEESYGRHKGRENLLMEGFNDLFSAFAANHSSGIAPDEASNIDLAEKLHQHICTYAFDCSLKVFEQIARGYVEDERFKKNIDSFGPGTARYVCEAARVYVAGRIE